MSTTDNRGHDALTRGQRDTLELAIGYIASSERSDRHEHIARIRAILSAFPGEHPEAGQPGPACDPADVCAGCRCEYGASYRAPDEHAPDEPAPDEQAAIPVAHRVLRRNTVSGEWVTDGRYWNDGAPSADLLAETAVRSNDWRVEIAYGARASSATETGAEGVAAKNVAPSEVFWRHYARTNVMHALRWIQPASPAHQILTTLNEHLAAEVVAPELPQERINAIADGLFDHGRITDKLPPLNRGDFREIIGSAIAEWSSQDQAAVDEKCADAASGIADHLDSLEGQLHYFLGRVKAIPTYEMIDLVVLNIRERLSKIRALAAPQPAQADAQAEAREPISKELRDTLRLAIGYIGSTDRSDRFIHTARINALIAAGSAPADAGEAVAYTHPDRLKRIADRKSQCETLWSDALVEDGDIPLYTAPPAASVARLTASLRQAREELSNVEWENDPPARVTDLLSAIDSLLNGADHA